MTKPEPYDEQKDPDRFWVPDAWERGLMLPPGFLTDMLYHSRGYESPSAYVIWSTLFAISAVLKRDTWLKWGHGRLYPNLYVLLIGPAASKKGTAMDFAYNTLKGFRKHLQDANIKTLKHFMSVMKNKATPEAIVDSLGWEGHARPTKVFRDEYGEAIRGKDGKPLLYKKKGEACLIAPEMGAFLGKEKYMQGAIPLLLELYDCQDPLEYRTMSRGLQRVPETFFSLLTGSTISGFQEYLPKSAVTDGFLSRMTIVHVERGEREFHKPRITAAGPDIIEMRKRLAYIAEVNVGEQDFSEEADALAKDWYHQFHVQRNAMIEQSGILFREDIHLWKLALLMKAQAYKSGPQIDVEDVQAAIRLIEKTVVGVRVVEADLQTDEYWKALKHVSLYIEKKGKCSRKSILMSTKVKSADLNAVLSHLMLQGLIVIEYNGHRMAKPTERSDENYLWKEAYEAQNQRSRPGKSVASVPVQQVDRQDSEAPPPDTVYSTPDPEGGWEGDEPSPPS